MFTNLCGLPSILSMPGWVTLVQDAKRAAPPPKMMNADLLYYLYRACSPNLFSDSLLHRSTLHIYVFNGAFLTYLAAQSPPAAFATKTQ